MRKLVFILIALIAVVTFIRSADSNNLKAEERTPVIANEVVAP